MFIERQVFVYQKALFFMDFDPSLAWAIAEYGGLVAVDFIGWDGTFLGTSLVNADQLVAHVEGWVNGAKS